MSMHRKPCTPLEEAGLRAHGLDVGTPSQLSDVFRQGVAWALASAQPSAGVGVARVRKSLEDRGFRHASELEDLLRMAGNVIAEDGLIIEHMKARARATPSEPTPAAAGSADDSQSLLREAEYWRKYDGLASGGDNGAAAGSAEAVELPDDGELEAWRKTADDLLICATPSQATLRKAAHLLQNAYLFASKLKATPPAQTPAPTANAQEPQG